MAMGLSLRLFGGVMKKSPRKANHKIESQRQARRGEMRMSILVHRATDEIDRLEMFALAKSEEGQSVLIARIEHLESVLKETKGYLIESKVKIKELEQDLGESESRM
jgi:hypothetical protein